ncbi:hypothetical protein OSB04_000943 [Centaurea solstitialis]|uniref:GTD-binding domain-containing protein n=1 Tax=Centaurea solstitialis TaxID=347529 RepID=A0AA38WL08_9ASTR|nr:hypothetical protein OSB04_000943 [Centaurea solstitialis]
MAATKGLMDHLFMAACEWFLMFWVFIDAALASSLTKFAQYCELQIPCLLCSRFDHFFGNEEPVSNLSLFCNKHQGDISCLIYCDLHNKLADVREMCEDCLRSVTLQSRSNLECLRFVVSAVGREKEGYRKSNKNFVCVSSGIRTCCCCRRRWRAKSGGRAMVHHPNMVGSGEAKGNTKPPLPRVSRRNRSRRPDNLKKMRNKIKHRRVNPSFPIGFPEFRFTSDSEFDFLFSDDDDGSYKVVGIGERGLEDDSFAVGSKNDENESGTLRRRAYSTSDLGSLLLEAQLNESRRIRSASLTPNCLIGHGLPEMNKKLNVMQFPHGKTREFDLSKAQRDKKPSSSNGYEILDASQDQYKIFTRHSFSAADLRSALIREMLRDDSVPRRSASVTPNTSSGYGMGEDHFPKSQSRPKAKRYKKSRNTNKGKGSLDDSVVSRKTSGHHTHNQNQVPRRHSCSVFHVGNGILLNMPVDESLTSRSIDHGMEEPKKSKLRKGEKENNPLPPTGHFTKRCGYHLISFDMGSPVLVENHRGQSSRNRSASVTPNGYGYGEPKRLKHQNRPNTSHPYEFRSHNHGKTKKDKKQLPSMNSNNRLSSPPNVRNEFLATSLDDSVISRNSDNKKAKRHGSLDDSVVSRRTYQNQFGIPRRHSVSSFDLGRALLLEMQLDESSNSHSSSHHSTEPNSMHSHHRRSKKDKHPLPLPPNSISLDDSVVSKNRGSYNQHSGPRRHSYSVLELGCAILLNMKPDETPTDSASLDPNDYVGHGSALQKDKKHLPPMSSVKGFGSSSDVRSDLSIDKAKRHGSLDDSVVVSRSMGSQNQQETPRRHSISAFDLGRALLVEMYLDESLKRCYASSVPNCSAGILSNELSQSSLQNQPSSHSSDHNSMHSAPFPHQKSKLPPPYSSIDHRSDRLTTSSKEADEYKSLDDSFVVSRNTSEYDQYKSPRRHSYSVYEMGLTPNHSVGHNLDEPKNSKTESRPNYLNARQRGEGSRHKRCRKDVGSSVDARSDSLYKPDGNVSFDDSYISYNRDNQNRHSGLSRSAYSTSDLRSLHLQQLNFHEGSTGKSSASLTGELNWLTFQTGTNSCSLEFGHLSSKPGGSYRKRKKYDYPKAKKSKKSLPSTNYVKVVANYASDTDQSDGYVSFDDAIGSSNEDSRATRYNVFSRNSQSATDLGSAYLLDMNLEDNLRRRAASMTPNCETGYPKSPTGPSRYHSPEPDSPHPVQFHIEEPKKRDPHEFEKDKKPPLHPTSSDVSTNIKSDLCTSCLDKIDGRSMDGRSICDSEIDGSADKQKLQAEDDLRCMRLLQSELEAERNAATVAAHHAMNMITRLQQEKAALQMEALQYLRMMEEQAEYDMEALQKANELVEEKENEIQDLLDELEHYRRKYGDQSTRNVRAPIKSLEEEKRYVLQWLSTLEQKLNQIASVQTSNGMSNGDVRNKEKVHLNDENNLSISKGVHDKSLENENRLVDLSTVEHEIAYLKEKMEAFEADIEFLKHACNALNSDEGLEFIQEISLQIQDLRSFMFDRKYISSS